MSLFSTPKHVYKKLVLDWPVLTLLLWAIVVAYFAWFIPHFELDVSADSLVLENDQDLNYYRSIRARYGSDDYLIVTCTPHQELFSRQGLANLKSLRDRLEGMQTVESVVSVLDVPLLESPLVSLDELRETVHTLSDPDTDIVLAKRELQESTLYKNRLLSPDGKTTALQVYFHKDETYYHLQKARNTLQEKRLDVALTDEEERELVRLTAAYKEYKTASMEQQEADIR